MIARIREWLRRRADATPPDPDAQWKQARALQVERRFAEAASAYEALAAQLEAPGERARLAAVMNQLGLARLRMNDFDRARAPLERAATLVPEDPSYSGCARFPALMSRDLPLDREAMPPSPRAGSAAIEAEIAYFFVGRAQAPSYAEYCALLALSLRLARRALPGCRTVILTDEGTPFPEDVVADEIARLPLATDAIMLARLQAMAAYLGRRANEDAGRPILFCDPDTELLRDPSEAFAAGADIAFAARSDFVDARLDHEPFTAGAIYARATQAAAGFFARAAAELDAIDAWPEVRGFYPRSLREWRGDQLVPAALVGWRAYAEHVLSGSTDRLRIGDAEVAFVPSARFCRTWQAGLDEASLGDTVLLDYKGGRKAAMLARHRDGAR